MKFEITDDIKEASTFCLRAKAEALGRLARKRPDLFGVEKVTFTKVFRTPIIKLDDGRKYAGFAVRIWLEGGRTFKERVKNPTTLYAVQMNE